MAHEQEHVDWNQMMRTTGPYPLEAYGFVREGLSYTADRVHVGADSMETERHISGRELCMGLRDYAIRQYGLLAPAVLDHWHVNRTDDFGRIVFAMIEAGLMSKTPEDTIDDFRAVYDFDEAFSRQELLAHIGDLSSV